MKCKAFHFSINIQSVQKPSELLPLPERLKK